MRVSIYVCTFTLLFFPNNLMDCLSILSQLPYWINLGGAGNKNTKDNNNNNNYYYY